MDKASLRYWLVIILTALAILLVVSSTMLWLVLPRGFFAARQLWVNLHKWGGLALCVTVLVHFLIHWKWLVGMTRRWLKKGKKAK